MLELLNAFGYMGINSVASSVYGLIRSKIIAAILGPAGVGLFSQANRFQIAVRQITTLGLNSGLVKLTAEYQNQGDYKKLNRLLTTSFLIFTGFGFLLIPASFLFGDQLAASVFGDPVYSIFVPIVVSAGFFFVQYAIVLNAFRGFLLWKAYVRVSILGYGLSTIFTALLIYWGGLTGAVVSILVTQIGNFAIAMYFFNVRITKKYDIRLLGAKPDLPLFMELVRLIGPLAFGGILTSVTIVLINSQLIHKLGTEANGIYQAVYGISISYMAFIMKTAFTYGIPKATLIAEAEDESGMNKIQNNTIKLSILFLVPISVVLLTLQKVWIPLLYRSDFLAAGSILVYQLLGDMMVGIRVGMDLDLLPKNRIRFLVIENVLNNSVWAGISIMLISRLGIKAVPIGYLIANCLVFLISLAYHRTKTRFLFDRENWQKLFKAIILVSATSILVDKFPGIGSNLITLALVGLIVMYWLPEENDWKKLLGYLKTNSRKNQ